MSGPTSQHALVAVGRPVRGEFTYLVPEALRGTLQIGQRIKVPFGRGTALAFYLGDAPTPTPEVLARLKPIDSVLESTPTLTPELTQLLRFAATHYRYPLGEALRTAMPPTLGVAKERKEASQDIITYAKAIDGTALDELVRAPAQHAALSYLTAVGGRATIEEVEIAIPGAREALKKLAARGAIAFEEVKRLHTVKDGLQSTRPAALTPEQEIAVTLLEAELVKGGFAPYLLHGVTGSGKTEVYLRVVERALELGKGALVLVPEIALTPQLVGRFRSRFGQGVALMHSGLKESERLRHWQALRRGEVKIAVGVRSAIFAPLHNLGVVVVDEEHDPSFKQEDKLRYQARDLAVVRAQQSKALVILGSATPSLETLYNVQQERYRVIELNHRVDDRPMPTVSMVDLRLERPRTPDTRGTEQPVLSPPLREAIGEVLDRGQQVILFLNRRGHATFLVCEVCGQSLKCEDCDVCLTYHLSSRQLLCHYCGRTQPLPNACPACSGPLLQLGIGTERVQAEVVETFPHARVARLDRDAATSAEALTEMLASFARRELDVLVGTQMVAKGHDFPGVTLVCVVLADTSLALPDFRASERTFHLLTQVAGRAGRGVDAGRVLVQTYNPDAEPVARVLHHDFAGFSKEELRRRKALAWPPYARMAVLRIEGSQPHTTATAAKRLADAMEKKMPPASHGVRLLGPAPAPISRIKGMTRWQLVVKGPTHASIAGPLAAAERELAELPSSVKVVIDVDPAALM